MPVAVCPNCGYDARGLPSDICPECGRRLPEAAPPWTPKLRWRIALGAAMIVATLAVAWMAIEASGVPRWWAPLPLTLVVPSFLTESLGLAFLLVTVVAALLSIPIVLGHVWISWGTAIPVLASVVLAWCYFASGISHGLRYQGRDYVIACGLIQAAVTLTLAGLWLVNRRRSSYFLVLAWHLLVSIWLTSYAFPYFGELP